MDRERRLRWPLAGILALGGLQGFIGWWMVSSGLSVRTDVSQYRLAAHLVMACLIFAACMWIMRGLSPHSNDAAPTESSRAWAATIAIFALFQIYLGALVAGLDAGFAYNTWPLMDGAIIPSDLLDPKARLDQFLRKPEDRSIHPSHRRLRALRARVDQHGGCAARSAPNHPRPPRCRSLRARHVAGRNRRSPRSFCRSRFIGVFYIRQAP